MRYDYLTMLPERAFQPTGGKMTYEGGGSKAPSMPAPAPPPPPPAAPEPAKAPDMEAARAKNKARMTGGADAGINSTLLTGPSGVDTNTLELGKNTLLGG